MKINKMLFNLGIAGIMVSFGSVVLISFLPVSFFGMSVWLTFFSIMTFVAGVIGLIAAFADIEEKKI